MINTIISWCLRNRFLVFTAYLAITGWGIISMMRQPIEAIPDLSENQVIVLAEWPGRSPRELEDQVTYPLSSSLQGMAGVKEVRATSDFGFSLITVVFEEGVDTYFARARVLERLSSLPFRLPEGVRPGLGPDATSLGWIFQYYLDDTEARASGRALDLAELRSLQDWFLRYQIGAVPGVAEVASVGGFVRQYQVDVDPDKLRAFNLSLRAVIESVRASNRNVGGGNIEIAGREITLRGLGLVEELNDLRRLVVGTAEGRPVLLEQVATVQFGPAPRRGVLDAGGREVVGGVVIMRYGESTMDVLQRVKARIAELQQGMPPGVVIRPFYDQEPLIRRAIDTLRAVLIEEIILVTLAHLIFLAHFRSAIIVTLPLPLSILIAFIFTRELGMTSNIMSLTGIAMAIGVLVDAGVVVTEAVMREAHRAQEGKIPGVQYPRDMVEIVRRATGLVARPIFYSLMIIILAFLPVFALSGQAGKLFHPLAFTKTFSMIGAALLAVTLVPVMASIFVRGKLHDEQDHPLMRFLLWLYLPVLRLALRFRVWVILGAAGVFIAACWLAWSLGVEFMPRLNERALLFMPTTLPGISVPEAARVMAAQNKLLLQIPEVASVVGKLGRAETATDPAPVRMIETTIELKPKEQWRPGVDEHELRRIITTEMMRFPGFPPAVLQPIENRIFMLDSGIRGQVAVKVLGSDLKQLQQIAIEVESILKTIPGASGVFAERIAEAPYLEIDVRREDAARYGVTVGEIMDVIETALGGMDLTTTIEGRRRFPVRVRYARELRDDFGKLAAVLVPSMSGAPVPLGRVADIRLVAGPSMITSENGFLRTYVQCNVEGRDLGGFVNEARSKVEQQIQLPTGTFITWGGQYRQLLAARHTLIWAGAVVIIIIFILLYMTYHSVLEALHVLLAVPFALTGGVMLQWLLGYDWSVAVGVGYIALFGTAVQTGVVMVIYLEEAVRRKRQEKGDAAVLTSGELTQAVIEGAALRLRPKVMTVATVVASLTAVMLPVLAGDRTGIEVMRPIAAPILGGMVSSLLHILIVTPVIFLTLREWEERRRAAVPDASRCQDKA